MRVYKFDSKIKELRTGRRSHRETSWPTMKILFSTLIPGNVMLTIMLSAKPRIKTVIAN
jgi:hypothetical protein